MPNPDPNLAPTTSIESDHPRIRDLADELTRTAADVPDRARSLFEYVRDEIRYTIYGSFHRVEDYLATATLERGRGFCVQKSILLVALARAAGIPARLVFADMINHRVPDSLIEMMGSNLFVQHCYVEFSIAGRWLQATPSFDRALSAEHGFPLVEFDGHTDAILPAVDMQGRPFVEYVAHYGTRSDLALEEMLDCWYAAYGAERVDGWIQANEAGLGQQTGL